VQNRQGKTRLSKWYDPYDDIEKRKLQNEIHKLINARESKFTNFLEVFLFVLCLIPILSANAIITHSFITHTNSLFHSLTLLTAHSFTLLLRSYLFTLHSSAHTKWCTGDMLDSSSACAWTKRTTSFPVWKRSTCS
jgi:hypothetical protein